MYIGSTDQRGLHQMIYEIAGSSVDEALAGYADRLDIVLRPDGAVVVRDNGSGISVDLDPERQMPILELVMTDLDYSRTFARGNYKTLSGLWRGGIVIANCLSTWARVEVRRGGQVYAQEYQAGIPTSPVAVIESDPAGRGTTITFQPDPAIFETTECDYTMLAHRFRELCYLTRGLTITFLDQRADQERQDTFYFEHGIRTWVQHLNRDHTPLHEPFYVEATVEQTAIEVALQYNDTSAEQVLSFVNNGETVDGGTHLAGCRAALTRTLNSYALKTGILKETDDKLMASDMSSGLTAIVSVKLTNPQFVTATTDRLGNPEVRGQVQRVVGPALRQFLNENQTAAQAIIAHCREAARARVAPKKARRGRTAG
jgi:DNA gyrase subunit B